MTKRKSLKGKGADIFLTESNNNIETEQHNDVVIEGATKATFYLPTELVDKLDILYLNLRKQYRGKKIKKSQIVKISLEILIADYIEKQNDSILVKHLNVNTL